MKTIQQTKVHIECSKKIKNKNSTVMHVTITHKELRKDADLKLFGIYMDWVRLKTKGQCLSSLQHMIKWHAKQLVF